MKSMRFPVILLLTSGFLFFAPQVSRAQFPGISTNIWEMPPDHAIENISMIMAAGIEMKGRTYDDSFWLAAEYMNLNGAFGNDVWAISPLARLNGIFADHARVLAQNVIVDGTISNGFWALAKSVFVTTNANLYGEQFIFCDNLTMQGHMEGSLIARARQVTLGGTIVGEVTIYGDDIIIRPGTTIVGDMVYVTTNRPIVLDANSHVTGLFKHVKPTDIIDPQIPRALNFLLQVYLFAASLIVGIPFILLFPRITGRTVQNLRQNLWKCGLAGIALLFGAPFIIVGSAITIIGIPFALVFTAAYGLIIYIGKYAVALLVGTAMLNRRGQISIPIATLSLVVGLFLYYSVGMIPYVGSSLQTTASAFGAGSLLFALLASRGKTGIKQNV